MPAPVDPAVPSSRSAQPFLPSVGGLARMIDHSLLHPTMTDADLTAGLQLARDCQCATACVKPYAVPLAADRLAGSEVAVCAVAGFPHGNSHPEIIVAEAQRAIAEGATEIDMVINAGKVLGGDWAYVTAEVTAVNVACVAQRAILKVIFENDYLRDEHIARLCRICTEAGVAFVKTSTGYGFVKQPDGSYNYQGATDPQLKLMRQTAGAQVQIKAAGGIRTLDDLLRVRALGVTRIGATATKSILLEAVRRGHPGPVPAGLLAMLGDAPRTAAGY
ncbi:MAG TPA: deoxyribose-phosphate aldolase [Opitutaceae bacterium]|nr:deoxyribose-phosphate aldolase [Opitutaceae bacterium]